MKEKLYTIPVTDAFQQDCECAICAMYDSLERNAIDFTMGPSYMEDDIRELTNASGFCSRHIPMLYTNQNRLGLALMLSTHMKKTREDISSLSHSSTPGKRGLLKYKKKPEETPLTTYIKQVANRCFICDRIEQVFHRYLVTVVYLYRTEPDFRDTLLKSKGVCMSHLGDLLEVASTELSSELYAKFQEELVALYTENMKRVEEELLWFIDKFDYRFKDEPWKNSKDALPRSILKTNHTFVE